MAIAKITNEVKLAIERKTAKTLPDQPTARGYSAETIRNTLYKWLSDSTNSLFAELDRIVDETNADIGNVADGTTDIDYDNVISGLTAATIKAAIDELDAILDNVIAGTQNITYNNAVSGLIATSLKAAIDELDSEIDNIKSGTTVVKEAEKATKDANDAIIHTTYEKLVNKKTTLNDNSDTYYPTQKAVKTAVDLKADKATTILGIDLENDITISEFRTALGNATDSLAGLMSATDKSRLDALHALLGTEADADAVVNTINELLAVLVNYPESVDLVTALAGKVDKVAGKELSSNDYTDDEQSKVSHLPANFTTFMGGYYTKDEVLVLLDQLTSAYGLTETEITELAHNGTLLLSSVEGYDYITLYLKHTDTHFVFDGKLIDPAVFVNANDMIQLNAWENGTQHSYGKVTYDGSTNLTFVASDVLDTLVIKGYKKEAISSDLVTTEHEETNYLDETVSVKAALEALDAQIKADVDDLADVVAGTTDITITEEDITATTIREAILEVNTKAVANAEDIAALSENYIEYGVREVVNQTSATLERVIRQNGRMLVGEATGLVANVGVDDSVVTNSFDSISIFARQRKTIEINGVSNVFVEVKRFYIKEEFTNESGTNYHYWFMCATKLAGYRTPLPFTTGGERDFAYIGAYEASLDANSKLRSITGVFPKVSYSRADFRTAARKNDGDGTNTDSKFLITDLAEYIDLVQIPMLIEFATKNIQSVLKGFDSGAYSDSHLATADGVSSLDANTIIVANATAAAFVIGQTIGVGTSRGGNQIASDRMITNIQVDTPSAGSATITFDGSAVQTLTGHFVYSLTYKTGKLDAAQSSSAVFTNNLGKYPIVWRGIENPHGNIFKNIDGIKIVNNQTYICVDPKLYNDTASSGGAYVFPYIKLSYVNALENGYVSSLGFDERYPFAKLPTGNAGANNTHYCDYYYQNTGDRTAFVGGDWYGGVGDGPFYWNLDSVLGGAYIRYGSRLSYRP